MFGSSFYFIFLIIDAMVALDCMPNSCCNFRVLFYIQVLCHED